MHLLLLIKLPNYPIGLHDCRIENASTIILRLDQQAKISQKSGYHKSRFHPHRSLTLLSEPAQAIVAAITERRRDLAQG